VRVYYIPLSYGTSRDRESKGEVSVTSPALCPFFYSPTILNNEGA